MYRPQCLLSLLLVLLLPGLLLAQDWTGALEDGEVVRVDPTTNRATVYSDKGSTQLWDGVHQLNDGSVIIVTDGVVTSGGGTTHQTPFVPQVTDETMTPTPSPCVELVIKVCGFNGECSDDESCSPARQLMKLEKEEAWQTRGKGGQETTAQCREALANEAFFKRCEIEKKVSKKPTSCQKLVSFVCGPAGECSESKPCAPARQLLEMESKERSLSRRTPQHPTYSSKKCSEALEKPDFFTGCSVPEPEPKPGYGDGSDSGTPASGMRPAPPQMPMPPHPLPAVPAMPLLPPG
jgi:hypothetical protein